MNRTIINAYRELARLQFERRVLYGHLERPQNIGLPSVTTLWGGPQMNTETFRANFLRFPWSR